MLKTGDGLVDYARRNLGAGYWWGCYGQIATQSLLDFKRRQYPDVYNTPLYYDAAKQFGKRVYDCCGLIKGYLWSDTPDSDPLYNSLQDVNVSGLYLRCNEKGTISKMPEILGLCVFTSSLDHVGIYIGEGYVIEARGHQFGVVTTRLSDRQFSLWGKPIYIDYSKSIFNNYDEPYNKLSNLDMQAVNKFPMLKEQSKGIFVKVLQILLVSKGYELQLTGLYDFETYQTVKKWQEKANLEVDGICGKNTWTSLLI